jgi:tricarballylate dehydrogenase
MPALVETVAEFNKACKADRPVNFTVRDGLATEGITPPKTNWAQRIDKAPFVAYAVACGLTFTWGGVKINTKAQVLDTVGEVIPGLYATGEVTGGIWHLNYTGGGGITLGVVFGRIAGELAVKEPAPT